MKWATDSGDMQYVEQDSVESAIRMIDYYEETYRRIQETIVTNSIGETKEAWLSLLGERFTSGDAVIAGRKVDMSRRSVYYALDQLCRLQHPLIEKLQHGVYRKLMTENTDAPHYCTFITSRNCAIFSKCKSAECNNTKIREPWVNTDFIYRNTNPNQDYMSELW